ncbi:MAG: protein translocase subunit SecF [Acidimicrobiia bacterium]|nr:protein translocase subunit SecF [Microthrixaceae bacterium]RTL05488.1 MAG: protein translocase subunit SecF [Acidimicrobiia bacterium]MCB9376552.1 protein translocase subunit SecF [Microthrixaceae bacterium]MCB9402159.1 protein translocase subunit SecF [Microthrixaceae bacterium]MCO5304630.1 protein translocase subunit SecF [Microthrixaceae bacterium]
MGLASDLYRGRNDFDFPRLWVRVGIVSTVLIIISLASMVTRGLNLSIDFEGGSVWEVPSATFTEAQARTALADFGDSAVERFQEATTTEGGRVIRVSGRVDNVAEGAKAADALAAASGLEKGEVKVNTVGPSWGSDITSQARLSLIVFMVLVAAYIAWRLETRMAIAAMVAVIHDIIITVGVYSVFQIEVTPATVISFLTILGFSLYDTIVVYDRVQENATRFGRSGQYTYTSIMRRSLNQVFMRSLNTTMVTIIPVISILVVGQIVFGQETLGDFSLALLIGLVSGTYSSLFVAPPVTAWLKEREPRWRQIRERLVAKGVDVSDTTWHVASAGAPAAATSGVPARPRRGATGTASRPTRSSTTAVEDRSTDPVSSTDPAEATVGDADAAPAPRNPYGSVPPRPRKTKKKR